jgi:hypothetical protein
MCESFPCFEALQWPGYATLVIDDVIDGTPIVIQLWKGLCPKFGGLVGLQSFPGGIGAEVGIYRRIPGKAPPTSFPGLPQLGMVQSLLNELGGRAGVDLWWPAPELNTTLEMTFTNPVTHEVMFTAGPETSYWLTKWMDEPAFLNYVHDHAVPLGFTDYILEFTVNGKRYPTWPRTPGDMGGLAEAAWLLLLDREEPKPHEPAGLAEATSLLLLDGPKQQPERVARPRLPRPRPHH